MGLVCYKALVFLNVSKRLSVIVGDMKLKRALVFSNNIFWLLNHRFEFNVRFKGAGLRNNH